MTANNNNKNNKDLNRKVLEDANEEKFNVSWTWYIFLLANVILLIGAAITWILCSNGLEYLYVPTLVCNLLSFVPLCIFLYFELKQIIPQRFHVKMKWYYFILSAVILFGVNIIISCFIIFIPTTSNTTCMINFIVLVVLSLVCVGLYRYGRFHIDKEIYCRRHGIELKQNQKYSSQRKLKREKVNKMSNEEFKKYREHLEEIDKKEMIGKQATSFLSDEKFENE